MKFTMKADIVLNARNIDDAFAQIAAHFTFLAGEGEDPQLIEKGHIVIEPVK